VKLKKKNQFSKKKIKKQKIKTILQLKGEIEKNNNFYKRSKKKNRNQNNEDQIEKHNKINLN
jgi:hypothetical protein